MGERLAFVLMLLHSDKLTILSPLARSNIDGVIVRLLPLLGPMINLILIIIIRGIIVAIAIIITGFRIDVGLRVIARNLDVVRYSALGSI